MSRIPCAGVVFLTVAGFALAQVPPAANAPAARPGAGRGGFAPIVIGPPAPVPPEVAIPRPTPAELAQVNEAVRRLIDADDVARQAAAEEVRIAADASAAAPECRGHLHADRAAEGPAARRFRRDRQEGRYRSAAGRRLDHRLVGAGRSQQGDVRQVLRRHQDRQLRDCRRHHPGRALGPEERRRPGISAEGDHADDRHQQHGGTNNAGSATAAEIAEGVGAVVLEMRNDFPNAKILLLAIFPRGAARRSGARQDCARSTGSSRGWTTSSTSSTWTSARSSWTIRATSSRMRSGPTTCTRRPKATTSGARR